MPHRMDIGVGDICKLAPGGTSLAYLEILGKVVAIDYERNYARWAQLEENSSTASVGHVHHIAFNRLILVRRALSNSDNILGFFPHKNEDPIGIDVDWRPWDEEDLV